MLTSAEGTRVRAIKAKLLAGKKVPAADAQWVLNMIAREQLPVRPAVVANAQRAGFSTVGIVTL